MKKPLIGILAFAYGLSLPLFAADTATLTLSRGFQKPAVPISSINNLSSVAERIPSIASQNSVTNARGVITRTVNLPDDASRKIIISSYD
jgi:hypothetical protein